ncbi:MAG: OsmC family protein [Bacteroidota bacterium]
MHHYKLSILWTGNKGLGTSHYRAYDRDHLIRAVGKNDIEGSSDPAFRGNPTKYNPEEMLVASLSSCHMLWFLHLCAEAGVVVTAYEDQAEGTMVETADKGGHFTEVILRPRVTVSKSDMIGQTEALHHQAHKLCFIANSCNFPIRNEAQCVAESN